MHEIKGQKKHSLRVIAKSGHKHTYLDLMVVMQKREEDKSSTTLIPCCTTFCTYAQVHL